MKLAVLDTRSGQLDMVSSNYTKFAYVTTNQKGSSAFIASSPEEFPCIAGYKRGVIRRIYEPPRSEPLPRDYISIPEYKEFPTAGGKKAYGLYYPPKNPEYEDRLAASPPLIIFCHGGPTGTTFPVLDLEIQYWTSRGFAVFDVNYGGSTGFGREFRERLKGNWGIVDVDDSVNGALFLASQNLADKDAMLIRGKSAGGYTTLCALTFRKAFRAGASYYGVSDLETFAIETHKFESRYSDYLLGPLPESKQVHKERSPINYLERITAPVIFFQGLDDKVVPPAQSEAVFRALKRRGIPTAYIAFEGERHGFHDAKNIVRCFESEYFFYSAVLGFQTSDNIKPVQSIENLPRGRQ